MCRQDQQRDLSEIQHARDAKGAAGAMALSYPSGMG